MPGLIEKALEGLFAATDYPDFEVIVVDNGSTDPETLAPLPGNERASRQFPRRYPRGAIQFLSRHQSRVRPVGRAFGAFPQQ